MADALRSIREIDSSIAQFQHLLATSSRSDPSRARSLIGLSVMQDRRYKLSNQREDCDKSMFHLTEAILLLPPHSWLEQGPRILNILFFLARRLFTRSKVYCQHEDAIYAAKYLRYLRDQPQFASHRHKVTAYLVGVLAYQVKSEARNVMEYIEEMATLCHELLTSNASDDDTNHSIIHLANVVYSEIYLWTPDQPLNQVIECLRLARKHWHKPDLRGIRFAFAWSLVCRYSTTYVNDDYEGAASALDEFITSSPTGGEFVDSAQQLVVVLAMIRSFTQGTPEYVEGAIHHIHAYPGPSSFKDSYAEVAAQQRRHYFGSIEGQEVLSSNSSSPLSQLAPVASFKGPKTRPVEKLKLLEGLLSEIRSNDNMKIEEAVESGRTALGSAPTDLASSGRFLIFGEILDEAFERTNKTEYLDEAIDTYRQVFERTLIPVLRHPAFIRLSNSLFTRIRVGSYSSNRMQMTQDRTEVVKLLAQCVDDGRVSLFERFRLACLTASLARRTRLGPSFVSKAYENALSLMQDTMLFAPTLQLQHTVIVVKELDISCRVPLDYASYQVDLNLLKEAIETLERGRALLWSEMRRLRPSTDQLFQVDPQLGHEFSAVNRDLDELTKSIPPNYKFSTDDGAANDLSAADPFGRLLLRRRKLLKERDSLISQIQILPGFDGFLTSPSFDTLRSAASCGPVIIINHSEWRSDILVLLHNTSPSLIPTPRDFYHRTSALKDKLLESRTKYGLDSSHYGEALASVLAELYEFIGKPVIDRLRQLQVPEQSRVWWCPTSVFCSLPLHAMGPIPSEDGEIRYLLDLYISSYTPSLSALIQSRNHDSGPRSLGRPSLLLVAQPDPSLPTVGGEIQVVQALDTEVTSLISEAATPAAVIDSFHHHRFVHFACHGTLKAGRPLEAGFELYGDKRLTLLEIVRLHLLTGEFAFLSACHTAEMTEQSVVDEGLHLAAAVQYCGFRSVVGTMWAMVDEDGQHLAELFYKTLFSNPRREEGMPYHERSAKALRFAVKKLRRKRRMTLERWVNFVHYGA